MVGKICQNNCTLLVWLKRSFLTNVSNIKIINVKFVCATSVFSFVMQLSLRVNNCIPELYEQIKITYRQGKTVTSMSLTLSERKFQVKQFIK